MNATLRGALQVMDASQLSRQIGELVSLMEPPAGEGWQFCEIDPTFSRSLQGHITGFRMPIAEFDIKAKISQEQNAADRSGIIEGLKQRGSFQDIAMAQIIALHDDKTPEASIKSLIEGLRAVSPSGNIMAKRPQSAFRRLALTL